jgi:hypothetical protein
MNPLATDSVIGVTARHDPGRATPGPVPDGAPEPSGPRDDAFVDLFRAQYPRILAYLLRRLGEPETARDLAADVFRLAWERGLEGPLPVRHGSS